MFARYLGSNPSGKQENGMVLYGRVDQSDEVARVMTNLAFLHFRRRLLNSQLCPLDVATQYIA